MLERERRRDKILYVSVGKEKKRKRKQFLQNLYYKKPKSPLIEVDEGAKYGTNLIKYICILISIIGVKLLVY